MQSILTLLLFLTLATPVLATDGVLEINQTCAAQTGCFSGDTAGYPVTIDGTAGRSYRLTGDLVVPDADTDGIVVSTGDVGIDLNNFTIIRSGCEGATTNCTPASGAGSGIERTDLQNRGISVKNGSITGMGRFGVLLGEQAEVTGLRVRWNGHDGIAVQSGSTITGNTAYENGGDGISTGAASTVTGNTAYLNEGDGLSVSLGANVSGNTVSNNGVSGDGWGINFFFGSTAAYRNNVIISPVTGTRGTVTGVGVDAGGNVCNGSLTCP